jgi:uncharacterized protein (TIGR02145 family)
MGGTGLPIVKYGYLYNWYAGQGTGNASITSSDVWRVPDITDTDYLTTRLGSGNIAGQRLKEAGTEHWLSNNGTNTVNWSARGSVARGSDGIFAVTIKSYFDMWINYDFNSTLASYLIINDANSLNRSLFNKKTGMAIRLLRNATVSEQLQSDGSACAPYVGNDGLSYPTVKIGTQVWLACNLAETKYRGGTDITNITDNAQWAGLTSGAMCAYNNDITNVFMSSYQDNFVQKTIKYGYLYNYYVIEGTGNASIIPLDMANAGWTVPLGGVSGYNINTLINYNGGSSGDAGKLKEVGETYWQGNIGTFSAYNFNARGSGFRQTGDGAFSSLRYRFRIWEYYAPQTYYFSLYNNGANGGYGDLTGAKDSGLAIRLVRPASVAEQLQADGSACAPYVGNDGLSYPTVKIGTQVWLAVNLAETKLRGGSDIPNVTNGSTWTSLTTIGRCAYDNDINNVFI